jgi:glycosyltransferase involved in cell wall biosynthesis
MAVDDGRMRLAFLTGCVEPGRDGVGDYTRLLATECAARGVPVVIVALADRYVDAAVAERWPENISVLRLPPTSTWTSRLTAARAMLREFQPSWVSVQFVQYSYQRWGMPLRLITAVRRLVGRARVHVMFHEIWTGPTRSIRRRVVSAVQRRLVLRLARACEPFVHTSNTCYRDLLRADGVEASVLPLFGNVPVGGAVDEHWLLATLEAAGCSGIAHRRHDWWIVVLFGTIHPEWSPTPLLPQLTEAATAAGKRLAVVSVGRLGAGDSSWNAMASEHHDAAVFVRIGEQPGERVATLLDLADFGVATSPFVLLGKSGTVAAMFDHGLPVIVNREDGLVVDDADLDDRRRALIIRMDARFADRVQAARRLPAESGVARCAAQWLQALGAAGLATARAS